MTIRNFDALLKPRSVALIGASPKPGSVGLITAQSLLSGGFSGPIWLVNPKHRTIEGHECHASVAELPSADRTTLSEIEAKDLLAAYGIPVVRTSIAATPEEVGRLAEGIVAEHGACVIKILSDERSGRRKPHARRSRRVLKRGNAPADPALRRR